MDIDKLKLVEKALVELLQVHSDLMPGVRYLALQNYTILNTAALNGDEALRIVRQELEQVESIRNRKRIKDGVVRA